MASSIQKSFLKRVFNAVCFLNERLAISVDRSNVNNVKSLLNKGADPYALNGSGRSALMDASAQGQVDIVKIFLAHASEDEDFEKNKIKAFFEAVKHNHFDVVKDFQKSGISPNVIKEARIVAVGSGKLDMFLELEKVQEFEEGELDQLLIKSVKQKDSKIYVDLVKNIALRSDTNINAVDKSGNTALIWTAARGYFKIEQFLLSLKADSAIENKKGHTAVTIAAHNGYEKSVLLIDPNFPKLKITKKSSDGPFSPTL